MPNLKNAKKKVLVIKKKEEENNNNGNVDNKPIPKTKKYKEYNKRCQYKLYGSGSKKYVWTQK